MASVFRFEFYISTNESEEMVPTYEYECQKCGHTFEALQRMTDKPLKKCEKCSGPVKRLISLGSGIIFKGSGFYETDYKRAPSKKSDKPDTKPCQTGQGDCSSCKMKD